MGLEPIMNEDGAIDHGAGSSISGGVFVITSAPSTKVKALGKGIYKGNLLYTFSGGDAAGFDPGSVATLVPQTISPTAVQVKSEGSLVIRLGDSGTMAAQGTVGGAPTPISGPVEVSDAGQNKVKAQ